MDDDASAAAARWNRHLVRFASDFTGGQPLSVGLPVGMSCTRMLGPHRFDIAPTDPTNAVELVHLADGAVVASGPMLRVTVAGARHLDAVRPLADLLRSDRRLEPRGDPLAAPRPVRVVVRLDGTAVSADGLEQGALVVARAMLADRALVVHARGWDLSAPLDLVRITDIAPYLDGRRAHVARGA